jgi:hypothetical protein
VNRFMEHGGYRQPLLIPVRLQSQYRP